MIELMIDGNNSVTLNDDGTIDIIKDHEHEDTTDFVNSDNLPSFVNIIND